mmetsp:Transcript_6181/g.9081  ORF Transcript_6181/g.9081 Transcript_6181/m.9081 type:complete len:462 (+) Transcript_6181:191-1576(+)|eukprot:CAMPEP_0194077352 /NCGR_PEP_ID=MMETSP0149-20130528/3985_1 /TAXON_ID=122233 /ORGANISM="Chaetoceros debilis, Strain MM31A-1" /LENGTH=461 /DNA_ID=CAMNT_0038758341 /DNA_START=98 /DNA_END=1483 /DNA_ORIENTATION=-
MDNEKELHIAPMLHYSTQEFLHFMRILSKRAVLWTEMVVDETIKFTNDLDHHLGQSPKDLRPIICQIGGRNPEWIGEATEIVEKYGFNEVNLNIDCPSNRVSGKRQFGAILMKQKERASVLVATMSSNVKNVPISVKTRVGIELDDGECLDTFEHLVGFISLLRDRGCRKFIMHARKCVIGGLTPAQNRLVPPLNYPRVYDLCNEFPDCEFIINGGIPGLKVAKEICCGKVQDRIESAALMDNNKQCGHEGQSQHIVPCKLCGASNGSCTVSPLVAPNNLKGSMLGRACIENPAMFWDVDRYFYGEAHNPCTTRREALEKYCLYLEKIYPRRCCDVDKRKTNRLPAPETEKISLGGCEICKKNYGASQSLFPPESKEIRISSIVIDRSLKPVFGIFFGKRKGNQFRRELNRLSRDKAVRNCGPAYMIRKAVQIMPQDALEEAFVKTENLNESDVSVHVSPS